MAQGELRIDVTERSAEEFIAGLRHAATRMVATARNDEERDGALRLCDWADQAEQERALAEREAWLAEHSATGREVWAAGHDRGVAVAADEHSRKALDEQIADARAGGWAWAGEQAWMDAHMPKIELERLADWLHGSAG